MIGVVVELSVKPSKVDELKEIFAALQEKVRLNEPGALVYRLAKRRGDANAFVIIELYQDKDAVALHSNSDYLRESRPRLAACFAEEPVLKLLDVVV